MAKILFLSAQYPPQTKGGGEISTHIIARGLQEMGHTVHVVTSGSRNEEYELDNVPIKILPLELTKKPLLEKNTSVQAARMLKKYIDGLEEYTCIHAHDFRSALMLSQLHMPQAVVTARDYAQISGCTNNIQYNGNIDPGCQGANELWNCHRIAETSLARKPFRMWQYMANRPYRRAAFKKFNHQIFISQSQKDLIRKYQDISHQHTGVIYNPISPEYLEEPLQKGTEGKVLYAGRVEMYKGVLLLLQAWRNIASKNKQAHLTIAGDGAQRIEYERLAATWGLQYSVSFIPHVPYHRLQNMLNESEIVVAPHLWVEPFGRTVIEGMSRGKIVISANCGGPSEIIQHEKTGLLFERESGEELQKTLEDALSMNHFDKREMGIAARDFVRDNLNMKAIAISHQNFYEQMVQGK